VYYFHWYTQSPSLLARKSTSLVRTTGGGSGERRSNERGGLPEPTRDRQFLKRNRFDVTRLAVRAWEVGDAIVAARGVIVRQNSRPGLLDVAQVAERLGVAPRYVRRLVAERRIGYFKVGHLLRFERDEVDLWIEKQRVAPLRSI
jgi:excisionase family DNA binding protein